MNNTSSIVVTHFINPHLFWYYDVDTCKEQFKIVNRIESTFQLVPKKKFVEHFQSGDRVVALYLRWNKYIRTEILHRPKNKNDEFIVWATDYGFPFLTKKNTMCSMPLNAAEHNTHIKRGGIGGIIPIKPESCIEYTPHDIVYRHWPQEICDVLEKQLSDASSIKFIDTYQISGTIKHNWGNIIITNQQNDDINIRNYLLGEARAAEICLQFKSLSHMMRSIKIEPWISNDLRDKYTINFTVHKPCNPTPQKENVMVDDLLQRKVYEWHARNSQAELLNETSIMKSVDNSDFFSIDDIKFDDSVSSIVEKRQKHTIDKYHQDYNQDTITNEIDVNDEGGNYDEKRRFELQHQDNYITELGRLMLIDEKMSLKKARKVYCPEDERFTTDFSDHNTLNVRDPEQGTLNESQHHSTQSGSNTEHVSSRMQTVLKLRAKYCARNEECNANETTAPSSTNLESSVTQVLELTKIHPQVQHNSECINSLQTAGVDNKHFNTHHQKQRIQIKPKHCATQSGSNTEHVSSRMQTVLKLRAKYCARNEEYNASETAAPSSINSEYRVTQVQAPAENLPKVQHNYESINAIQVAEVDQKNFNTHHQKQGTLNKPKHYATQSESNTEHITPRMQRLLQLRAMLSAPNEEWNAIETTAPLSTNLESSVIQVQEPTEIHSQVQQNYNSINALETAGVDHKKLSTRDQEQRTLNKPKHCATQSGSNTEHVSSRMQTVLKLRAKYCARNEECNASETAAPSSTNPKSTSVQGLIERLHRVL